MKDAVRCNRQRMQRPKCRTLQKRRSEVVERGFAHICETGGARRTWLRGLENIRKRHLIAVAAHNLGLVMRHLVGFGKPRVFVAASGLFCLCFHIIQISARFSKSATVTDRIHRPLQFVASRFPRPSFHFSLPLKHAFSQGL
ncbi:MAG: transposase [Planctomycetota bacterium]